MLLQLSLGLIIGSAALYHVCQKELTRGLNPWAIISAAYLVALALSLVGLAVSKKTSESVSLSRLISEGWPILGLGAACVGIEVGYQFAYRQGGNLSTLFTRTTVGGAILLVFIGVFVYGEPISLKKMIGLALATAGISLIRH